MLGCSLAHGMVEEENIFIAFVRRMSNFPYMEWNVLVLFAVDQRLKMIKAKYDFVKAITRCIKQARSLLARSLYLLQCVCCRHCDFLKWGLAKWNLREIWKHIYCPYRWSLFPSHSLQIWDNGLQGLSTATRHTVAFTFFFLSSPPPLPLFF